MEKRLFREKRCSEGLYSDLPISFKTPGVCVWNHQTFSLLDFGDPVYWISRAWEWLNTWTASAFCAWWRHSKNISDIDTWITPRAGPEATLQHEKLRRIFLSYYCWVTQKPVDCLPFKCLKTAFLSANLLLLCCWGTEYQTWVECVCVSVKERQGGRQRSALLRSVSYNMQQDLDFIHGRVRTAFLDEMLTVFPFREFNIFWWPASDFFFSPFFYKDKQANVMD